MTEKPKEKTKYEIQEEQDMEENKADLKASEANITKMLKKYGKVVRNDDLHGFFKALGYLVFVKIKSNRSMTIHLAYSDKRFQIRARKHTKADETIPMYRWDGWFEINKFTDYITMDRIETRLTELIKFAKSF